MLNVAQLREQASRWLVDTGAIDRKTGETTIDPDTYEQVDVYEHVYTGPMMLYPHAEASSAAAGETTFTVKKYDLVIFADVQGAGSDRVTLDTSKYDLALVGVHFTITDVVVESFEIARTVIVTRVT